ncbi:RNA-binding protein [Bacillus sp. HMF5848]|uniref:YlmH family RNA-binding protein n=1 Tax=Bacillus sp. HMF5848 TaxID=2495421 RepID=UPI000F7A93FC|nr:RNA-binding protein [Bacillus sp. HMF5848]RSK26956.1 RNA-binding protein [Bacillus sp. HMF5848]
MSVYQHYRKEEHAFVDQVIEWKDAVITQYAPKLSDFLDPREQQIAKSVIGKHDDVLLQFNGGGPYTERKRALIYPSYYEPTVHDFDLKLFEMNYPDKFVNLEHPQILGSVLGLGLRRGKFGDILISDDKRIQIVVAAEIGDYVSMHLEKIGKTVVSVQAVDLNNIIHKTDNWLEKVNSFSSFRLDTIAAGIFNVSRQKIAPLIQNGHVKVNWQVITDTSFGCKEGDVLSVRGFGRSKLLQFEGTTKKDKIRLRYGLQK